MTQSQEPPPAPVKPKRPNEIDPNELAQSSKRLKFDDSENSNVSSETENNEEPNETLKTSNDIFDQLQPADLDAIDKATDVALYNKRVLEKFSKLNEPLIKLDRQMNLYKPPLKNAKGNELINVRRKKYKGKFYTNITYTGLNQKFLIGTGHRCFKFSAMTPFARTRFCDELPFGLFRNRFNDPNSEDYKEPKYKLKLMNSALSFQLTNERLTESQFTNEAMDEWLDWAEQVDRIVFEQVFKNIEKLYPAIYTQIKNKLEKDEKETTSENIRKSLSERWRGIVNVDSKSTQTRYVNFALRLFRFASQTEIQLLEQSDFECISKNEEITKALKKTLTQIPDGSDDPIPRWENELDVYRCLSNQERKQNPEGGLFIKMTYDEIKDTFAGKNCIVSVAMEFSLGTNDNVITLKHEPIGILYLGNVNLFDTKPELANINDICFDSIS